MPPYTPSRGDAMRARETAVGLLKNMQEGSEVLQEKSLAGTEHDMPLSKPFLKTLPTEVWEIVIDCCYEVPSIHLGGEIKNKLPSNTFLTCASICRSWYPRSRLNLYQDIFIVTESMLKRLADCLRYFPCNAEFIRSIRLQSDAHARSWAHYLTPILLGSLILPNLRKLSYSVRHHHYVSYAAPPKWLKIGRESHNIFIPSWSTFRSIDCLDLADIEFSSSTSLARFILAFPSVRDLTLRSLETRPRRSPPPNSLSDIARHIVNQTKKKRFRLRSFTCYPTKSVLRWLLASGSFDGLQHLSLTYINCDYEPTIGALHEVLQVSGDALASLVLHLDISTYHTKDFPSVNLSRNLHLQRLGLEESVCIDEGIKPTITIRWLINILSTVTSNQLTHLTVQLYLWEFVPKDWDTLDALLVARRFRSLKHISLEVFRMFNEAKGINMGAAIDSDGRELSGQFDDLLPRLFSAGILEARLEDYDDDPDL